MNGDERAWVSREKERLYGRCLVSLAIGASESI